MLGGNIYCDDKCPICGGKLKNNYRNACCCPDHLQVKGTCLKVHFKGVWKRFNNYQNAFAWLSAQRVKASEGSFDPRDYRKDNPLGFENQALKWLAIRKSEVAPDGLSENTYRAIKDHIYKACAVWGNQNVKHIKLSDFQLFLAQWDVKAKSKANYLQTLKQFFRWLCDNEELKDLPKFPKVKYELAWRKTIDKDMQRQIIEKVQEISNFKTYLGIKWLATYFNVRPEEMRNIKEGHIDIRQAEILIPHPKENRSKFIYLLPEDVSILKEMPKAIDTDLYFFRHPNGQQFGEKYFYKWWKRACKELKIEGVDLYGGTRHSSVRALRKKCSPEQIRAASMHATNKAFERYYRTDGDDLRAIYKAGNPDKLLSKVSCHSDKG